MRAYVRVKRADVSGGENVEDRSRHDRISGWRSAVRGCDRHRDPAFPAGQRRKDLLASIAAATVALVSGTATQFIIICHLYPETHVSGVTGSNVMVSYLSSLLSIPVGMGWGWACSFVGNPANKTRRSSAPSFVVRGLVFTFVATSVLLVVVFVGRLAWYGHDNTIGLPGLSAAFVFLVLMMVLAVGGGSSFCKTSTGVVLRQVGAGFTGAIILALGVFIGAVAVDSLLLGLARLVEAGNVLIFFYPVYLVASFGIAGVLLFYGGRKFARAWTHTSGSVSAAH